MFNLFRKYVTVGLLNTIIHWAIFIVLNVLLNNDQSFSNLIAFITTVSISYVLNAKYTFKKKKNITKYIMFVFFMGILSFSIGKIADIVNANAIFTLISFSGISLIIGFLFSKYVIFKDKK